GADPGELPVFEVAEVDGDTVRYTIYSARWALAADVALGTSFTESASFEALAAGEPMVTVLDREWQYFSRPDLVAPDDPLLGSDPQVWGRLPKSVADAARNDRSGRVLEAMEAAGEPSDPLQAFAHLDVELTSTGIDEFGHASYGACVPMRDQFQFAWNTDQNQDHNFEEFLALLPAELVDAESCVEITLDTQDRILRTKIEIGLGPGSEQSQPSDLLPWAMDTERVYQPVDITIPDGPYVDLTDTWATARPGHLRQVNRRTTPHTTPPAAAGESPTAGTAGETNTGTDDRKPTESEQPVAVPVEMTARCADAGGQAVASHSEVLCLGDALLDGTALESATVQQVGPDPVVSLVFRPGPAGIDQFNAAAATCYAGAPDADICPTGRLAVLVAKEVVVAPIIYEPAFERDALVLSGGFTQPEAEEIARLVPEAQFRPVLWAALTDN
ncbi:MAG: hypothetical protein GY701_21120, partial [Sulfitobacter sp.]|nr:hypothetical protein [Sulfitobacter sp.]